VLAYTSTPYRGLDLLLRAFPRIRAAVPGVTLQVFSGMRLYGVAEAEEQERFGKLYERCRKTEGVEYVGSVPQPELARRLRAATVLAYPNTFPETSCIAVLEAMAAGCRVVTSELGALPETAGGFASLIPFGAGGDVYLDRFVEETVAVLEHLDGTAEDHLRRQVAHVQECGSWAGLADEWMRWLG
jgi:glycosyltransferase involved in cell wall biosynthesis